MVLPPSTNSTRQKQRAQELTEDDGNRFIDLGVKIICVRKDPSGAVPPGTSLPAVVKGKRKPFFLGGRWDRTLRRFVDGPCRYRTWLVGKKQYDILVGKRQTRHNLLYSAEGAGKTVLMAMWVWAQILVAATAGIGGTIGATAPTGARLGTLVKAVTDLAPVGTSRQHVQGEWGTLKVDDNDLHVGTGRHWIQFRSTKKQSGELGSPIQGWNWGLGAAIDECQDSIAAYEDIVARLRSGPSAPIMATATAKDSPDWRTWRDARSKNWTIHRLSYKDTPFVHNSHWEMMQLECSAREWMRRGLALDVPPENATYSEFSRDTNLERIPDGAIDITEQALSRWGGNFKVLAGHDPGKLYDVTLLFKLYRLPRVKRPVWFCVDEITTERTTTASHVKVLLKRLREKWNCNILDRYGQPSEFGPKVFVRADPYSDSGNDDRSPDKSVYTIFRNAGISILPAALKANVEKVKVAKVPKEAGIEMVCSLLCNVANENRLRVAIGDDSEPVAPGLVRAFEMSERDGDGRAETQRKDKHDLSHWPATTRYALWMIEKPKYKGHDQEAA